MASAKKKKVVRKIGKPDKKIGKKVPHKRYNRAHPNSPVSPGYKFSDETRRRMSKARKGRKLSPATRKKIQEARVERETLIQMGLLEPFRHTEETKEHLRKVMKKKKHRPTRAAIRKSALERSELAKVKRASKKIMKQIV